VNTLRLSRNWPDVEILFEDDSLLALNKPAGLLVAPDRWDKQRENIMGLLPVARPGQYIANAHRLDFNTTGVFLLAKSMPALINVVRQFNERTTRKTYVALSAGQPTQAEFTIEAPIGSHPRQRGLVRIDHKSGKEATSVVRVVERFRRHTLLHVDLLTGRQHQIRVHLQFAGYPLVGDTDYGGMPLLLSQIKRGYKAKDGAEERPLLARPALHAESLRLKHPVSGEDLTIQATWPRDLEVAVKYLRRYAPA
jgi:RluA family pseudouridine synthase